MRQYCPHAVTLGRATLRGRSLGFTKYADDPEAGGCDLLLTPDEVTVGVLYGLSREEMLHLDDVSGVGRGWYARVPIVVEREGEEQLEACTYMVPSPLGSFRPDDAYLERVRSGARSAGLPDAYVRKLNTMLDAVTSLPE
jgi:hypothetical protein